LAKRITSSGGTVTRINVVDDNVDDIASILRESMERRNDYVITVGGLGPTFDDKTLQGVAKAFGRKLTVNDKALEMVEDKYRSYVAEGRIGQFELTSSRVKMAKLPEEAEPLPNPVGTAPGVKIKWGKKTIISLPGVPSEMKTIFEDSVLPTLKKATGNLTFLEAGMKVTSVVESELAPIIDDVMNGNPYVYIKSHPQGAERIPRIEFHLSTTAKNFTVARNRLKKALSQLSKMIKKKGGKINGVRQGI
ncbi:MAG: competence damage-inducible protein A, partial [Desulfobacterales bacterium]|nr:competence damage-inducible protein A [Desulfobacterales bacterium]